VGNYQGWQEELRLALDATSRAGELILEHYAVFQPIPDAPAAISTETDRRSQDIIVGAIRAAFPDDAIRAEEKTSGLKDVPDAGARLWIVDPIDGTRGFARKNGEFAVMLAFVDSGLPTLGVVLEPASGRLTYAVRGGGCWRKDSSTPEARQCFVSRTPLLSDMTLVQSHSKPNAGPSAMVRALGPKRVAETYSAGIKLVLVARGEADLYVNSYPACHDWDACAGQVLVEEAGGRVTDLDGSQLRYDQSGPTLFHGLLASNGLLHDQVMCALRNVPIS
jgi:3'(2'), 5'-bisphosphate nucleotidase